MSRNPYRSSKMQQTNPQPADHDRVADEAIIAEAHALYGSECGDRGGLLWTERLVRG